MNLYALFFYAPTLFLTTTLCSNEAPCIRRFKNPIEWVQENGTAEELDHLLAKKGVHGWGKDAINSYYEDPRTAKWYWHNPTLTPLFVAVAEKKYMQASILLKRGALPLFPNAGGAINPFDQAHDNCDAQMISLLMDQSSKRSKRERLTLNTKKLLTGCRRQRVLSLNQ